MKEEEEDGEEVKKKYWQEREKENSTCTHDCTKVILPLMYSRSSAILCLFFAQYILVMQMEWQPLILMTSLPHYNTFSFPLQSFERESNNFPKETKPIAKIVGLEARSALHQKTAHTTRNYPASLKFCLPPMSSFPVSSILWTLGCRSWTEAALVEMILGWWWVISPCAGPFLMHFGCEFFEDRAVPYTFLGHQRLVQNLAHESFSWVFVEWMNCFDFPHLI